MLDSECRCTAPTYFANQELEMTNPVSNRTSELAKNAEENRKLQNEFAQKQMEPRLVDLFAKMVKKSDENSQAAV